MADDAEDDTPTTTPTMAEQLRYLYALRAELERIVADMAADDLDPPPARLH